MTYIKQLDIWNWLNIMEMLHFLVEIMVLWFCFGRKKESLPFRDSYWNICGLNDMISGIASK